MIKRVGILRGGAEEGYEKSIRDGGVILSHVRENLSDSWKPMDILIDKDGVWHLGGVPILPVDLMHKIDVAWNMVHSSMSGILSDIGVSYVGVGTFSHILFNNKEVLAKHLESIGVKMPRHIVLPLYQEDFDGPKDKYAFRKAQEIHAKFPAPWIVRSYTDEPNMGVHVTKTFPELEKAIEDGVAHRRSILVEELIYGKEASMHSISGFRGKDIYVFPFQIKSVFTNTEKEKLHNLTRGLHDHLGARHYLNLNFIVHPRQGVYLTSINFSPDMSPESHFSKSCESASAKAHHVIEHILENALNK